MIHFPWSTNDVEHFASIVTFVNFSGPQLELEHWGIVPVSTQSCHSVLSSRLVVDHILVLLGSNILEENVTRSW